MRYFEVIRTANGNLKKSKLRTFLTASAVFMGALTLMLTFGVGAGLKAYVEEQVSAAGAKDALIIIPKGEAVAGISNEEPVAYDAESSNTSGSPGGIGGFPTINGEDLASIEARNEIISIDPLYNIEPEYLAYQDKQFKGIVFQYLEGLNIPMSAGRLIDNNSGQNEITIAPAFVEAFGFSTQQEAVGKELTIAFRIATGAIEQRQAIIVGVQEKTLIQGNAMQISLPLAQDIYQATRNGLPQAQQEVYGAAVAKYDTSISEQELLNLKTELDEAGFNAQTLDDQLGIITSIIDGITTFLTVFAAIALAAASFGIVNTLLMAVQERTREIGLMKALGMSRGKIFALFSIEAVLIGFWGSIIALLAANVLGRIGNTVATNTILKDFEGLELFSFPAISMIPIVLLVMAIAFFAATLPARRASRLDPIEALRYE